MKKVGPMSKSPLHAPGKSGTNKAERSVHAQGIARCYQKAVIGTIEKIDGCVRNAGAEVEQNIIRIQLAHVCKYFLFLPIFELYRLQLARRHRNEPQPRYGCIYDQIVQIAGLAL